MCACRHIELTANWPRGAQHPRSSELQGELDAARPGDTLLFPANYTATGNYILHKRPILRDSAGLHSLFESEQLMRPLLVSGSRSATPP